MPVSIWLHTVTGISRGTLKHSYLDNLFLFVNSSLGLAQALEEGGAEQVKSLINGILNSLVNGYNPAQLIEVIDPNQMTPPLKPFQQLPCDQRRAIRNAVDRYYRENFRPEKRKAELQKATKPFLAALDYFTAVAKKGDEIGLTNAHRELKACAQQLRDILESLPKGIWLW